MSLLYTSRHVCLHLLFLLLYPGLVRQVAAHIEHSLVLLISFDGFRYDYIDMAKKAGKELPNFDRFINEGVKAEYVKGAFVTKTFPNHYTIVTGMYEENHGIVHNKMYDPVYEEAVKMYEPDGNDIKWWNNGATEREAAPEPIWITNQRAQTTLFTRRSGIYFWPGSEVDFYGMQPHHWVHFDDSVPYETQVTEMVSWFATEEDPINLGLLYINQPDHLGHQVGPEHPAIGDKLVELDGVLGLLFEQLEAEHLDDHVNIIVTSDHGMAAVSADRIIALDQLLDSSLYTAYGGSPVYNILPKEGQEEAVFAALSNVPHLHAYQKENIPAEYHYRNNRRVLPIVLAAEEGWSIQLNSSGNWTNKGDHGYNNSLSSMHPIFLAHGPGFKKGFASGPINNVDIYSLLCELLSLTPHANDGDLERIEHILLSHAEEETGMFHLDQTLVTYLLVFLLCTLISTVCCMAACRTTRYSVHRRRHPLAIPMDAMLDGKMEAKVHLLSAVSDEEEEIP